MLNGPIGPRVSMVPKGHQWLNQPMRPQSTSKRRGEENASRLRPLPPGWPVLNKGNGRPGRLLPQVAPIGPRPSPLRWNYYWLRVVGPPSYSFCLHRSLASLSSGAMVNQQEAVMTNPTEGSEEPSNTKRPCCCATKNWCASYSCCYYVAYWLPLRGTDVPTPTFKRNMVLL
jgi:hypothetical protein